MIRKIIEIDEELCNGCGLCADACHEGAIGMVNGKARLLRDDYCDGLGACLPSCPTGAIGFIEKDTAEFNESAVKEHLAAKKAAASEHAAAGAPSDMPPKQKAPLACGCPGTNMKSIQRKDGSESAPAAATQTKSYVPQSRLNQWPVQIKLVPVNAPYFKNADLLIAADCTAYAYGDFHNKFIKNRITIIGCPKLDQGSYAEKLTEILKNNDINSVTVARMEVPCCGGISDAAVSALRNCGKMIPWRVVIISTDGSILNSDD